MRDRNFTNKVYKQLRKKNYILGTLLMQAMLHSVIAQ